MTRPRILLLSGAVLLAALMAAWLLRFRVADRLVERRLAAAGVPASYRLTRLDPLRQRIEDVRIGDPAAPDLTAARIDLTIGYSLGGPELRELRAEGLRVRGRIDSAGLHLGALDRLLPRTGGGAALPDLHLDLRNARLALATANGTADVTLDGAGNPTRSFRGRARVTAPDLRIASCRLMAVRADLAVTARSGAPGGRGAIAVAQARCPGVALGPGTLQVAGEADAGLRRFAGRAAPSGFAGAAGGLRMAGVTGEVRGVGGADAVDARAQLNVAGLSAPAAVRAVSTAPDLAGTPLAPTLARSRAALAALLARSDGTVDLTLRARDGAVQADVRRAVLRGTDGARLTAEARGGLSWSMAGLRLDGDLRSGGGALPSLSVQLRQPSVGAPVQGTVQLAPYRAGDAILAVPQARFTRAGEVITIDGRLRLDGPLADGAVRGLEMPVRGRVDTDGAFAFGMGCFTATANMVQLAAVRFTEVSVPVCGRPLLARSAAGPVRMAGSAGPLLLHGRTGSDAAVTIAAHGARLSGERFAVSRLDATIGAEPTPTRIAVSDLDGRLVSGGAGGAFAGAAARIGAVPLALSDAAGRWRFADGALRLTGTLRVADTATQPRFRPLAGTDAALALRNGVITAATVLREPASQAEVARVAVDHDLARGTGAASLAVNGLRFAPKGLQPDAITPLTLGVVANVAGTVTGKGRIAWNAGGVTSSGSFATDRLDLAAAFGPVTGIAGRIDFTDLLGLVSAPGQRAVVAEINPGIPITDGAVQFHLPGANRVAVADARWPFAGGTLRLEPAVVDLSADRDRRLTFRLDAVDAAAFVQQLDLPNVSATGTFDGVLPMAFGQTGGRIERGTIAARAPGGTLAYVGELSSARLGTMGKLAFDALKAIRYSALAIDLDGQLDGEMVSRVRFTGVREATPDQSLVTRLIRGLPFRFNIAVRAPFRGLIGTARSYADPSLLLRQVQPGAAAAIQPPASAGVP